MMISHCTVPSQVQSKLFFGLFCHDFHLLSSGIATKLQANSMWNANKHCLILFAIGALLLAALHLFLMGQDPELADKITYTGFCLLLFACGLVSWVLARKGNDGE